MSDLRSPKPDGTDSSSEGSSAVDPAGGTTLSDDQLSDIVASFAELAEAARREGGTLRVKASELGIVAGRVADLAGDCINLRLRERRLVERVDQWAKDTGMYGISRVVRAALKEQP